MNKRIAKKVMISGVRHDTPYSKMQFKNAIARYMRMGKDDRRSIFIAMATNAGMSSTEALKLAGS